MECHVGESALQKRSGHDRTLHPAARNPIVAWLNGRSATDPRYPEVGWSYQIRDDQLVVDRTAGGRAAALVLDYALGSGKHGMTFVALRADPNKPASPAIEHRLSYLADGRRLTITPGQEANSQDPHDGDNPGVTAFGNPLGPVRLRDCFGCHATWISPIIPGPSEAPSMIPHVRCERCHGPGRHHVDAARRGETDLTMRMGPGRDPPNVEVERCGECHRLPMLVPGSWIRPDNPAIVRFQGVGISKSACYADGRGGLRCTTCHDPHDRASRDHAVYEAACISCHRSVPTWNVCPVSPALGCVDCHMPRRELPGNGVFTDHWIRKPAATGRGAGKPAGPVQSRWFPAVARESAE
jgi:hypothetical protein